jgi:hypothetical protein
VLRLPNDGLNRDGTAKESSETLRSQMPYMRVQWLAGFLARVSSGLEQQDLPMDMCWGRVWHFNDSRRPV